MVIARTDPNSELGRRFVAAFPEYYSEAETSGPFPLSFLQEEARRDGSEEEPDRSCFLELNGTLSKYHVPFIMVSVGEGDRYENHITDEEAEAMGIEDITDLGLDFGKIIKYHGQDYFVAETSGTYLVPIEVLDISAWSSPPTQIPDKTRRALQGGFFVFCISTVEWASSRAEPRAIVGQHSFCFKI